MKTIKTPILLAATALVLTLSLPTSAVDQGFMIVVNDSNPSTTIRAEDLSRMFLKQTANWPNGIPVVPIDQAAKNEVRETFSIAVHKRDTDAIRAHWQRMVFSGRAVPPVEKGSDDEVLSTVQANRGAVGYVSASTTLLPGVKVLEVTGL